LEEVLNNGEKREDRTGTGTLSLFASNLKFRNIEEKFPLVTTKKTHLKSIIYELLWLISGNTNIKYLKDNGVSIWDEWADKNGDLGNIYGKQWRDWDGIDQLQIAIDTIKNNPESRRNIVNAWNVGELQNMALPPCHMFYQFYVRKGKYLDCHMYQRSADLFLGVPFNIASYALLTMMVARVTNLRAGDLTMSFGDSHIYTNHIEQVKLQLEREPFDSPIMKIATNKSIDEYTYGDFELQGYMAHPHIKGKVAI
jgi:thymidylate synthase